LTGACAIRGGAIFRLGSRFQPRDLDLADLGRKVDRAQVHGLGDRLVDQVDHELAGLADFDRGVLGAAQRADAEAEHDQRRLLGEHVEETERRRVDTSLGIPRGDQRDRARHDEAAQQLVALGGGELGEIEAHGHAWRRATKRPPPSRPAANSPTKNA
jgi:hypothetical protein